MDFTTKTHRINEDILDSQNTQKTIHVIIFICIIYIIHVYRAIDENLWNYNNFMFFQYDCMHHNCIYGIIIVGDSIVTVPHDIDSSCNTNYATFRFTGISR